MKVHIKNMNKPKNNKKKKLVKPPPKMNADNYKNIQRVLPSINMSKMIKKLEKPKTVNIESIFIKKK